MVVAVAGTAPSSPVPSVRATRSPWPPTPRRHPAVRCRQPADTTRGAPRPRPGRSRTPPRASSCHIRPVTSVSTVTELDGEE